MEERKGKPTRVKGAGGGKDPGILRIDFPIYSGKYSLEEIPWEEFFEKFEENRLAFLYQDKTATGKVSRFRRKKNRRSSLPYCSQPLDPPAVREEEVRIRTGMAPEEAGSRAKPE